MTATNMCSNLGGFRCGPPICKRVVSSIFLMIQKAVSCVNVLYNTKVEFLNAVVLMVIVASCMYIIFGGLLLCRGSQIY